MLDIFSAVGNYYHIAPAEGGVVKLTQLLNQCRSAGFIRHDIALVFSQGSAVFGVEDYIKFLCSILRRKGIGRISVKYVPGIVVHSFRIGKYIAVTQLDAFQIFRINSIFGQGHAVGDIHGIVIGFHRSFRNHAVLHIQINGLLDIFSAVGNYYHIAPAEGGVVKLTQLLNQCRSAGFIRHDIALVFSQGSAVFGVEDYIKFLCSILRRKGIGRISVKYVPGVVIHSVRIGEYIAVTQLDAFCRLFRLVVIPTGSGRFLISSRGGIHRFFFCRRLRNGSALVGHHALISHHVLQISSGSGFGHAAKLHDVPYRLFQGCLVVIHHRHIIMRGNNSAV